MQPQNVFSKCILKISHQNVSYFFFLIKNLIKMRHKNVSSKYPINMSPFTVSLISPLEFSSKYLLKMYYQILFIKMFHQNVSTKCLIKCITQISQQNISSKCLVQMSPQNISSKCLLKMSPLNVSSKCLSEMSPKKNLIKMSH